LIYLFPIAILVIREQFYDENPLTPHSKEKNLYKNRALFILHQQSKSSASETFFPHSTALQTQSFRFPGAAFDFERKKVLPLDLWLRFCS
jgi:hypothetical protein